jgi:aminotransferase
LHGDRGCDLALGAPDFPPPDEVREAAVSILAGQVHQYPPTPGLPKLRAALAETRSRMHGHAIDPEDEVTITTGATEGIMAALLSVADHGDEVVLMEPAYEGYLRGVRAIGAVPRLVRLHPPRWELDPDELARAFSPRVRAVVVNSPHNPTGRLFGAEELELVARLCREHDVVAITDEVYEGLVYERPLVPLASLPGMRERTITVSGASKSLALTGWRLGWTIASPGLTAELRTAHEILTLTGSHPLQAALLSALPLPERFYSDLVAGYRRRRDVLVSGLRRLGFVAEPPEGAFYVLAGHPDLPAGSGTELAEILMGHGVASVPLSVFYLRGDADPDVPPMVRLTFAKRVETLERALAALADLGRKRPRRPAAVRAPGRAIPPIQSMQEE